MKTSETNALLPQVVPSVEEEILIKNLLISHDPDGHDYDVELLLQAVKNVLYFATSSDSELHMAEIKTDSYFKDVGLHESVGHIVDKVSCEMLNKHHQGENLQVRTMKLLDSLSNFLWNEKMVFILAGLAFSYSEFWLVIQLRHQNPLAGSISMLKQLPGDLKLLRPLLKALNCLIEMMLELTEHVVQFDSLPISEVTVDPELIETTKHHMYLAVYWVARSAIRGCSHIIDLRAVKPKRVCRHSTAAAAWELLSLVPKLSNLCCRLQRLVEVCHRKTEDNIYEKLLGLFKKVQIDNQEVLRVLFSLKHNLPFKQSISQEKLSISVFKDKVVILFISNQSLPVPEELLLLFHQMYGDPYISGLDRNYEIIYTPIPMSTSWTDAEQKNYDLVSNFLPWYSISKPWLLSSAVLKFIKEEWNYKEEPIAVVIDTKGSVTNVNAIDAMMVWGSKAYPFSVSREEELWNAEKSSFTVMFSEIAPLMTERIRRGRNICIYGGDDIKWIREVHAKIEETILHEGLQLEIIYVGKRTITSQVRNMLLTETRNWPTNVSLSITNIQFFWIRLDRIRRSILRQRNTSIILKDVMGLLEFEENETGWAIIRDGSSLDTLKLREKEVIECLDMFLRCKGNVPKWGLVGAMRIAIEQPSTANPCNHSEVVPFEDSLVGKTLFCDRCKHMKKGIIIYE